uniref:Protein kinase domain-containing protein n=1 Tax=viral metagenome TaxID=1070528 RepID=A0A6C0JFC3_9ZZZZ
MNNTNIPKFQMHYVKSKKLLLESLEKQVELNPIDLENDYNPFRIQNLQNYNPIYSLFFELTESNFNKISLNHKYHFLDMNHIVDIESKIEYEKEVFIKYSPLIDPFRYMTGKYKVETETVKQLPNPYKNDTQIQPMSKVSYYNNASYIDNFFSFLVSKFMQQHNFLHGVDYYGSYLGVQDKFKVNISDDLEYLSSSDYFSKNNNKLFSITFNEKDEFANFGSRGNKEKLIINNQSLHNLSVDNLEIEIETLDNDTVISNKEELVYEKTCTNTLSSSDSSSDSSSVNSVEDTEENKDVSSDEDTSATYSTGDEWTSCTETDEDDEDGSDCDYEEETQQYAFVNNFPIQLICLEKCAGTLDELFEKDEISESIGAAALMQIIMTLIVYQKAFHFTHNDLHTNNIMYVHTHHKYLYYRFNKITYKVPTYGKIFKIIDFGRSIYKYNGQLLFSDSFSEGNDAATQYNCEPFMNEDKPRIDPNYSFDLSRLGASIYDFIIEDDRNPENFDNLQDIIYRWCLDDNGKNVLYKRNGEERYPNFKLYKMIARTVHKHVPQDQLELPIFKQFVQKGNKTDKTENLLDIDSLPVYI